MYSFRIDREIIYKAKKEAKKLSISTAAFVRPAILEKIYNQNKIKDIVKDCLSSCYTSCPNVMSCTQSLPRGAQPQYRYQNQATACILY